MNVRRVRLFLWATCVSLSALAAAALMWGARNPFAHEWTSYQPMPGAQQVTIRSSDSQELEQELHLAAQVDLRRVLHDPPPPAPPPPPPPTPVPALDIRLSGTICEPEHSQAMIQMPDGTMELKGVGENAGNARILDIQTDSITVEYFGKSVVLTVAKEDGS